ncbi:flagellar motor protein MotB [bacterium]|jgi:flagellar motor protein MotB|nr:flagellar motor protein MotB [bacterium]
MIQQDFEEEGADGSGDVAAVYSDLMSFVAALFILLFTLSYNKEQDDTFFIKMSAQFGAKEVHQEKVLTSEDLFVSKLQGYINDEKLAQYVLILVDEQKIRLVMNDPLLFTPGQSKLTTHAKQVLSGFATIMAKMDNPIIVEGHTDNMKVGDSSSFDSNWDLSFYRAYEVLKYFRDAGGIRESRLSAHGFAGNRPMSSNKTQAGRSANRRVEINFIRVSKSTKQ